MKKIMIYAMGLLLLAGCSEEGLMDSTEVDIQNQEKVYSDVELTRKVLIDLYGRMRESNGSNSGSFSRLMSMTTTVALLDNATDDGAGNIARPQGVAGIQKYLSASITSSSNPVTDTHPWTYYYRAIRNANIFLEKVGGSPLTEEEKVSSANQARFLRAYYYHELFRWFGPVVISEKAEDPFAFATVKRATLEETVRFIANEFDALSQPGVLPDTCADADFGRVTRGAAMAFKARTLLYAASPLNQASGVTWAEAAQAADDLIKANLYKLYVDPTEPAKSYSRLFNTRVNSEIILSYMRAYNNDLYNQMPSFNPWNLNKEVTTAPTQWLVDSYDMIDGKEPVLGYTSNTAPIVNTASTYNEQNPFANRDPRFNQTILHDGSIWPLVNKTKNVKMDITTPNAWASGYYLVKFLDDRIDHRDNGTTSQNFPMMRYAEVLLDYAEAINEAENTPEARGKAVARINEIRDRAGVGRLDAAEYTQETLRQRIRKERRIELCFEEHRFFDIRRWKIAKDVMVLPAVGIAKENGQYVRKELDSRSYNERMDLMPIPRNEINNCPLLKQNPGY